MSWTPERVERLKKLHADGFSASQIAREFGDITRNAVISKIHRMGLNGPKRYRPRSSASIIKQTRKLEYSPNKPVKELRTLVAEMEAVSSSPAILPVRHEPVEHRRGVLLLELDEYGSQLMDGNDANANEFNCDILHKIYWSQRHIAQALGISKFKVQQILKRKAA